MTKISVIIPVYNGEKYIKTCLNSVLGQTLKEFEIIVINDASTDNTQTILEQYAKEYSSQIKIVKNEQNGGQGMARNIGINLAKGEFITFVDSDDEIEQNMLQKLYDFAKKEESDLVICDYFEVIDGKKNIKKAINQKVDDMKKSYITNIAGPCNKLIKTELLTKNELKFLETRAYEDISMVPLIGLYANNITYLEEPLYYYYIRTGSTMRQNTFNDKLLAIYEVLENLEESFKKTGKIEEFHDELEFIYIKHLLYASSGRFLEYKDGRKEINKIVKIMKQKYPNWKKNIYYKGQSKIFKINCCIFYSNCLFIIVPFRKIIEHIKKGKTWKS